MTMLMHVWLLQRDIVPVCRELGIGIVAYSPLGRGFLAGTLATPAAMEASDYRKHLSPRFEDGALQQVTPALPLLLPFSLPSPAYAQPA